MLDALRNEAYQRYQAGDLSNAETLCRQILQRDPRHAEAVYLLGVIAQDVGQPETACDFFRKAARMAPENAVFPNALGEILFNLGKQDEALLCFRKAAALRPTYERAHNNLGRLLHAKGDLKQARACFETAVKLNPQYATALNNLGAAIQAQGDVNLAATHFRKALAVKRDYPEAHFNLGTALQALGDPVTAAGHFQQAIRLRPTYARAHFHFGQVLEHQREERAALECYATATRLNPTDADMQRRYGDLLMLKGEWAAALEALEKAQSLKPDDAEPFARLVYGRQLVCDWRHYEADLERLWTDAQAQMAKNESSALVPFQAITLPWSRERLLTIARSHCDAVVRHQRERGQTANFKHPTERTGRLRVGYLSGDFYDHPISHLIQGLFGRHDREQIEVFAYSFSPPDNSPYRKRVESEVEHFVEVAALSVPALARRIFDDGIHVLVDLMGHTGINRLGAFALRPCPIQVSFLGMLGTMGADFMDYLVGDRFVTPPEFAGEFTEKFAVLPHSYLIAEPEPSIWDESKQPEIHRKSYGLPETGFVFCSFSSTYKVEPGSFAAWMRILAQVPDSVLWLYSPGVVFEGNVRREAEAQGIAPARLVFAGFIPRPEHLRRHLAADLFLDTLRYNAAATASLALQTGLPVLTCPGETFSSRVGASLLHSVGLPELIAPNVETYVRRAVELAQRPDELKGLREKLAGLRAAAPLFDTPRFVRNLERAYLKMWEIHAAGRPAEAFEVTEHDSPLPL